MNLIKKILKRKEKMDTLIFFGSLRSKKLLQIVLGKNLDNYLFLSNIQLEKDNINVPVFINIKNIKGSDLPLSNFFIIK